MAKKIKKFLKKAAPLLIAGLSARHLMGGRSPKSAIRNVHDTGAITQTPGRERWGPGVGGTTHIPKRKIWSGDQSMVDPYPLISPYQAAKGGRVRKAKVTGIAKRGFGRALKRK